MQRLAKNDEGDVGVKTHQSARAVREPTMLKAAAATRCTTDKDRRQRDAMDNAVRVKGFHAVPTKEMKTAGRFDGEHGKTDLDKVPDGPLREIGVRPGGHDESGAGARTWTSIDDRLKEVGEPKERETGLRRRQQGEPLKEVARVSNALDEESARRTVPNP